jgi:hypothetical protein
MAIGFKHLMTALLVLAVHVSRADATATHAMLLLSYNEADPHRNQCLTLRQGGPTYCFWLDPDKDINGLPIVLELAMRNQSDYRSDINLLQNGRNLHGYQVYDFAAKDYNNGVSNSIYGVNRTLAVDRLNIVINAHVLEIDLGSRAVGNTVSKTNYFKNLQLRLDITIN